jgi:hypothetical protein
VKSTFILFISWAFLFVFLAEGAHAATVDLSIATEYQINSETGEKVPLAMNPSGKAELTYFNNGIVLTYVGHDGGTHSIKIHLDFGFLLNTDMKMRAEATAVYDRIKKDGPAKIGLIIRESVTYAKASGHSVTIMVDAHRTVGFLRTEFDLANVRLMSSGGENERLQRMVGALFTPNKTNPKTQTHSGIADCERSFTAMPN